MTALATYRFLSWVRTGLAAGLQNPDTLDASQPAQASLQVSLAINTTSDAVAMPVALYGPGDVTGIASAQIVRVYPAPDTHNHEPNYFPLVEFDRPDFPWMFTPAAARADARLRPWICLVAVEERDGVSISAGPHGAVLSVDNAALELPDLADSWMWAHAQLIGGDNMATPEAELAGSPALSLSRLLCHRQLMANKSYIACVIPTFAVGATAGLGENVAPADLAKSDPSWLSGSTASVTLPVYFSWRFSTGPAGDFETLAHRLSIPTPLPLLGTRHMEIGQAGPGLDLASGASSIMNMPSALQSVGTQADAWPGALTDYASAIRDEVDAAAAHVATPGPDEVPTVGPTLYGQWHAACNSLTDPHAPAWLTELNVDPRYRVAAGLGTQTVKSRQEELIASAWSQLGDLQPANRVLRLAQLARAAGGSLWQRHLQPMNPPALVSLSTGIHARVLGGPGATMAAKIDASSLPAAMTWGPFRRMTSAAGPLAAQVSRVSSTTPRWSAFSLVVSRVATRQIATRPVFRAPDGTLSLTDPARASTPPPVAHPPIPAGPVRAAIPFPATVAAPRGLAPITPASQPAVVSPVPVATARETLIVLPDPSTLLATNQTVAQAAHDAREVTPGAIGMLSGAASPLGAAFVAVQRMAGQAQGSLIVVSDAPTSPSRPDLELAGMASTLIVTTNPEQTSVARALGRVTRPPTIPTGADPLQTMLAAPQFTAPTWSWLTALSKDWLIQGLEALPPDSITLVETNPPFIEAFLVGLNHEISRLLLWREFPTDQRGTYAGRFWSDQPDIGPITEFDGNHLGADLLDTPPSTPTDDERRVVVLIRGELLRRYPGTIIYAVPTGPDGGPSDLDNSSAVLMPKFRGDIAPDITFVGFELSVSVARGDDGKGGWWFVIAEQPCAPRFGLEPALTTPPATPNNWNDASWSLMASSGDLAALTYAPRQPAQLNGVVIDGVSWGQSAAGMARITFRRLYRAVVHCRDGLPKKA